MLKMIKYRMLEMGFVLTRETERVIQRDLAWMTQSVQNPAGRPVVYLVDVEGLTRPSMGTARAVCNVFDERAVDYTDGVIVGCYALPKQIYELSDDELRGLSKEHARTLLPLKMLSRLKAIMDSLHKGPVRSDEVADAALEILAEERGKDKDHFK